MSPLTCRTPIALPELLAWWLGELEEAAAARVEEHFLGCAECSVRIEELTALADGVRAQTRAGGVHLVVNDAFARRLVSRGVRVREYHVPHNGSVNCTIAPEDDVVIARLDVPLGGVTRLDLVEVGPGDRGPARLEDIPFRTGDDGVVLVSRTDRLRTLPESTTRVRLLAVDQSSERLLGEYVFHHTPPGTG